MSKRQACSLRSSLPSCSLGLSSPLDAGGVLTPCESLKKVEKTGVEEVILKGKHLQRMKATA